MMLFKVCRDCGEEYRPEVQRCADCGGELVARYAEGTGPDGELLEPAADGRPPGEPEPLDPAELRTLHVADRAGDLLPLAQALGEAAIRFAVRGSPYQFALLVREADLDRATELLQSVLGQDATDEEGDEAGPASCPACGHALAAPVAECPACGLALEAPGGRLCPRCGRPIVPPARDCSFCDHGPHLE
jgi:uncharacterized OB-fold protein